jgi:pimeloyl-ACP methyl ester carboxylesterase
LGPLDAGLHLEAAVFIAPGTRLKDAFAVFVDRSEMPAGVADGLRAEIEHRFGADIWDEMQMVHSTGALDLPVLLIHDPADRQAPIEPVRTVAARWRSARLIEVEGLGHNRILSSPEVARHALSFLDEVATSDV